MWWSLNGYVLDSNIRDDIKLKGWSMPINPSTNSIANNYNHADYILILLLMCILYYCHTSVYFNVYKIKDKLIV